MGPTASFWDGRSVVVTGGAGFLGTPTVRMLSALGAEVRVTRSAEHDLTDATACREALEGADLVLHLAARVGGIGYNRRNPAPLARDNMAMGLNVFEACRELGVSKLLAACSVCAYPKFTPVPFSEDDLWDGFPEESNAPYGLAKKMLIVLSDAYRSQYELDSCVPVIANLYGPEDNFDLGLSVRWRFEGGRVFDAGALTRPDAPRLRRNPHQRAVGRGHPADRHKRPDRWWGALRRGSCA